MAAREDARLAGDEAVIVPVLAVRGFSGTSSLLTAESPETPNNAPPSPT